MFNRLCKAYLTFSTVNAQTNIDIVRTYGDNGIFDHPNGSVLTNCVETCFGIPPTIYKYLENNVAIPGL